MRYNGNMARNYISNVVSDLKDAGNVLKALYRSSLVRAERERTSLPVALRDNLINFYNNDLAVLCVSIPEFGGVAFYRPSYVPPLANFRNSGRKNHQKKKGRGWVSRAGASTNPNHRVGRRKGEPMRK